MARKRIRKPITKELDKVCRQIIYIRDGGHCQKCGKSVQGQDAHCSHVAPKSTGDILRWDLLNLKLLCFHCHINWWHKDPVAAGAWFRQKFPARYEYIESRRYKLAKFRDDDLLKMLEERKAKLAELTSE